MKQYECNIDDILGCLDSEFELEIQSHNSQVTTHHGSLTTKRLSSPELSCLILFHLIKPHCRFDCLR